MPKELHWRKEFPTQEECASGHEYFWVKCGHYNFEVVVSIFLGTKSQYLDYSHPKTVYYNELNYTFPGPYPQNIWQSDLKIWPGLQDLEWAGPIERPI